MAETSGKNNMKKKPHQFSESDKFYLMHHLGLQTWEELGAMLNCTADEVQKYVEDNNIEPANKKDDTEGPSSKLFIRPEKNGQKLGITIATNATSERGDSSARPSTKKVNDTMGCITHAHK